MWREDLERNCGKRGLGQAAVAMVLSPGFALITLARLAIRLRRARFVLWRHLARVIWRHNVRNYGCFVSLEARVGAGLLLPHPVGIVIGDGVSIGRNVTVFQNVTVGRRDQSAAEYPVIGHGVTIYAGATVLGAIEIGDGAVIGAHSLVMTDVPPGTVAVGSPARIIDKVS